MKTINSFIIEHSSNPNTRVLLRKGLSRVSNKQSTPDKIVYNKQKIYKYDDEHAYPFILNLVCNKIIWGENSSTHNDILFNMEDSEKKPYGLDDVLFVDELSFPEYVKDNKCGRIWVIPNSVSKNRKYDVYIAWWNELNDKDLLKYSKMVVNSFNTNFNNSLASYFIVNSTGDFILIDPDEHKTIVKRDDETRKQDLNILREIHLANQSEKNKYFKSFKQKRNTHNQERLWNTTKSKTAAEYNYIKTIGDSLDNNIYMTNKYNMKTLLEYILEAQSITFDGKNSKTYGQCIILAGGPGSGKGFIQNKILSSFKVYDVDDLKKQYIKLVKIGKIKDTENYDLKNPEDVGKIHNIVKEKGWKKIQRDMLWNQRSKKNDEHSSGLLSNILFDMVSDDINDILDVAVKAKIAGYTVTLIWVVCNEETAKIGNKIRDRRVDEKVIGKGHLGAFNTITALFDNKYPNVTELIDNAWVGFSAGYCRKLTDEYMKNPVVRVKSANDDKFTANISQIKDFLKDKMPIDYAAVNDILKKNEKKKVDQLNEWIDVIGDEYQPNSVKESYDDNYSFEDEYVNAWKNALQELL